ncbi:MAG: hypothetical protein ACFE0P_04345 [Oceanicaulis sp.]
MSLAKRASVLDVASAIAGGAFFAVTVFFFFGAAVWAVLSLLKAPLVFITTGEAIAVIASLVIGAAVARNAVKLSAAETA